MPSTSTLTSSEKSLIKKHGPTGSGDKIHAAAIGRVYYAYPDPAKWSYSGISGAITFGWGQGGGWLKVIDLAVRLSLIIHSDEEIDESGVCREREVIFGNMESSTI